MHSTPWFDKRIYRQNTPNLFSHNLFNATITTTQPEWVQDERARLRYEKEMASRMLRAAKKEKGGIGGGGGGGSGRRGS